VLGTDLNQHALSVRLHATRQLACGSPFMCCL
jgi:hypothetical protein